MESLPHRDDSDSLGRYHLDLQSLAGDRSCRIRIRRRTSLLQFLLRPPRRHLAVDRPDRHAYLQSASHSNRRLTGFDLRFFRLPAQRELRARDRQIDAPDRVGARPPVRQLRKTHRPRKADVDPGEKPSSRNSRHERRFRLLRVHQIVGREVRQCGLGNERARFGSEQ